MRVEPLVIKKKPKYTFDKPDGIPPEMKGVSPFWVHICVASRGYGKSFSICSLLKHMAKTGFYNRFIIVSPTYNSDITQNSTYEDIANMGYFVEHYDEATEENIKEIEENTKAYIELWEDYHRKKQIYDKLQKRGEKSLTDEELMTLFNEYLDDDVEVSEISETELFGDYPDWLKRDMPPATHIFYDDCYSSKLMSKTRDNPLIKQVVNGRHNFTSLSMAIQSISALPRSIRSNAQLWSVFPTKSKKDIDNLLLEVENAFPSHAHFYKCMEKAKDQEHGFLYIDGASMKHPIVKIGYNNRVEFE